MTEGLVEIALSRTFNQDLRYVRDAMLISGDISKVVLLAKRNLLHATLIKPLIPISYMLADVIFSAEEIINYYQKPLICEFKYDGIRAQMHKSGQQIRLFSRNLSDITTAFPELANAAKDVKLLSSIWRGDGFSKWQTTLFSRTPKKASQKETDGTNHDRNPACICSI